MDVHKLSIRKIFDATERFEVPLFQRPYVWSKTRNWEPLLEGILTVAEKKLDGTLGRPHFLGTIVLDQLRTPTGKIGGRQIIDGQQRLVTLQLALAAARDISGAHGQQSYEKAFRQLTDNDTPLSDCEDDIFKVWPTNDDQTDFKLVMRANSKEKVRKLPHSDPKDEWLIPDAYLFFYEKFIEWLADQASMDNNRKFGALYHALGEGLQVVVIDLEEKDDPQEIFETLNALGTPLLPADLVKNFLFRSAIEQKYDVYKLYAQYWKRFDMDRKYWREKVRQGRLHRPRIDLFLYHYLTLAMKEIILDSELFNRFKIFFAMQNAGDSVKHMEQFRNYGEIYQKFDNYPQNSREQLFFYRLEQMDTTTLYPVLLEIIKCHGSQESRNELLEIMLDLESFLVRRMVCELTTKNYNRLFTEMIDKVSKNGSVSATAIRKFLLDQTADASKWPDNDHFELAWTQLPFYRRLRRSKTYLILEAIERSLYTEKTEHIDIQRSLTVEHILPQGWEEHWPLKYDQNIASAKERAEQLRRESLDKIGNLTLLTKRLNPAVSNGPWESKRREILKHSALNLNRYFQNTEVWDEDTIEKRTKELYKIALKLWPHP